MNAILEPEDAPADNGWQDEPTTGAGGVPTGSFRARLFARSLSAARLAAVAARPRFYTMPYLRRVDEPDADDLSL